MRILDFSDGFESSVEPTSVALPASLVSVTASGNLGSTNAQAALVELQGDINTINGKIGTASGIASLDSDGKVPSSQIPPIALVDVYAVADITARDALTVQEGDVAQVADAGSGVSKAYIYNGSGWLELVADGSLTSHMSDTSTHGVSSTVVGTSDSQTLTNKTIDADSNTISNIDDGNIKAGAGIAVAKLAALTGSRALETSAGGVIQPSSVTSTELGYLSGVTSNIQDQIDAAGGGGGTNILSITSKTANYTVQTTDDLVLSDSSAGTFTLNLYTPVGNTGRIVRVKKTDTSFTAVSISGTGLSTTVNTQGETLTVVSDGTNWVVLNRDIPRKATSFVMSIDASTTAPTKGTRTVDRASWERDGAYMVLTEEYKQTSNGAAGSGTYIYRLPSGVTMDSNFVTFDTSAGDPGSSCGVASLFDDANVNWFGSPAPYDSTGLKLFFMNPSTTDIQRSGATNMRLAAAQVHIYFRARVPITGWNT